jgi:hypothetical protein
MSTIDTFEELFITYWRKEWVKQFPELGESNSILIPVEGDRHIFLITDDDVINDTDYADTFPEGYKYASRDTEVDNYMRENIPGCKFYGDFVAIGIDTKKKTMWATYDYDGTEQRLFVMNYNDHNPEGAVRMFVPIVLQMAQV